MAYNSHALDELTVDGTFKEARDAAVSAAVTGSRGSTHTQSRRKRDGVVEEVSSITVEAVDQINGTCWFNGAANRKFGVWSWGPAYRVKDADVVIVLAHPGRYTSHAAVSA